MAKQIVFGWHTVGELLRRRPEHVLSITLQAAREDARARDIAQLAEVAGVHVDTGATQQLDRLADGASHQGIVAWVRERAELNDADLYDLLDAAEAPVLLLVLDGVQDPHNLGACLRVADGVGAQAVIAPKRRAVGLTQAVRKVASGAAESVPFVRVTNLAECLRALGDRDIRRIGTSDSAGDRFYALDLAGDLAVVVGGEARGLRRLTAERCDAVGALPMVGAVASLNVGVAAGIALYEARRQQSCAASRQ